MVEDCIQVDRELASIFCRWQIGKAIAEPDFLVMREKAVAAGLGLEAGPRWLIWDMLDDDLKSLHRDFQSYYQLDAVKVAWALQAAFDGALLAATPDIVTGFLEQGATWDRLVIDLTRQLLWGGLEIQFLTFDNLNNREFQIAFEKEWNDVLPYRDTNFGFRVIPRFSFDDIVRYQSFIHADPQIRSSLSCYMTHQALEAPHLLKLVSPDFTEVAFLRRLSLMYLPLINATVSQARRNLSIVYSRKQEREAIRDEAIAAFDGFVQHFQFFWRPKQEQPAFGAIGILGLTENEAARKEIDQLLEDHGSTLRTQDMAVYAFAHYMQVNMRFWVKVRYPSDATAPRQKSMDESHGKEGKEQTLHDRVSSKKTWPMDPEAYMDEDPDLEGPDGTGYMMKRQAARRYGISEDQLVRMDKAGSLPAMRVKDVFPDGCDYPRDTRLYALSQEMDRQAEIAKQRAKTRSSHLSGQQLNRKQAAYFLEVKERQLRHLENSGAITPARKGTTLVYDDAALNHARAIFDARAEKRAAKDT